MRRGLLAWREQELSTADVLARQSRLQSAASQEKLDAILVYTNHVRSAGVSYLTGFTPYWSDGILLLPSNSRGVFATALSNRVGEWIRANNPTVDVLHSPEPGRLVGERLLPASVVGVLELDMMPRGLTREIQSTADVTLVDATALFATVRSIPDLAELGLARKGDSIARAAFLAASRHAHSIGAITQALEVSVRNAGAEECYVAAAPDLSVESRLGRTKGSVSLGPTYAIRVSVAYNGVWVRRTETFSRDDDGGATAELTLAIDELANSLDLTRAPGPQISGYGLPAGASATKWSVEAPRGTRPLEVVVSNDWGTWSPISYGVLTLDIASSRGISVFSRPIGIHDEAGRLRSVA